jgi:hypothetical protein
MTKGVGVSAGQPEANAHGRRRAAICSPSRMVTPTVLPVGIAPLHTTFGASGPLCATAHGHEQRHGRDANTRRRLALTR